MDAPLRIGRPRKALGAGAAGRSGTHGALAVRPGAVEPAVVAGDVEGAQIIVAKAAVGRDGWRRMLGNDRAVRCKDGDTRSGAAFGPAAGCDDIAFCVDAHAVDPAVRSEIVQYPAFSERAVGPDRVGPELAVALWGRRGLGHVERSEVRGKGDAVWPGRIERDACDVPGAITARIQAVNGVVIQFHV